jgi:thiamine-phosphate pyrophosphorylase
MIFRMCHLYVVTQPPRAGQSYAAMVSAACAGGADAVQLRDKTLSSRELFRLAKDLQEICDKTGTLFILNDRVDVALAADVDGVHVGQEDLPVRVVREMMGHKKLIGCSTHSTAQALAAVGDGADYISCGPLFATPTKPDYLPVGLDLVKEYRQLVRFPLSPSAASTRRTWPRRLPPGRTGWRWCGPSPARRMWRRRRGLERPRFKTKAERQEALVQGG